MTDNYELKKLADNAFRLYRRAARAKGEVSKALRAAGDAVLTRMDALGFEPLCNVSGITWRKKNGTVEPTAADPAGPARDAGADQLGGLPS